MSSAKSASFKAPDWWRALAQKAVLDDVAIRDGGQVALAKALSKAIKRPWDHRPVSVFIATGQCPLDFALAVSKLLNIPPPIHIPRSLRESMEMQGVVHKYDLIAANVSEVGGTVVKLEPSSSPKHALQESAIDHRSHKKSGKR